MPATQPANPLTTPDSSPDAFWTRLDQLITSSRIVIDRPAGSTHPRYPHIRYPLDYGYLDGTSSGDGNGIDLWIGTQPHHRLTAVVCCVDSVKRDTEIKLLLGCSDAEVTLIRNFHSEGGQSALAISRKQN